jgi:hypothetical protein
VIDENTFAAAWVNVGYYSNNTDLVNTFQVVITSGDSPLSDSGRNVCFCYNGMDWTTGDASSGATRGFGGTPATVGANAGVSSIIVLLLLLHAETFQTNELDLPCLFVWLRMVSIIFYWAVSIDQDLTTMALTETVMVLTFVSNIKFGIELSVTFLLSNLSSCPRISVDFYSMCWDLASSTTSSGDYDGDDGYTDDEYYYDDYYMGGYGKKGSDDYYYNTGKKGDDMDDDYYYSGKKGGYGSNDYYGS